MPKIAFLLSIFLFTKVCGLYGQDSLYKGNFPPASQPFTIHAFHTDHTIIIDGRLDEAAWQEAITVDHFFQTEPVQAAPPVYKTEVKLLYNDRYLYIGAYCHDSLGKKGVRVQDYRRDFLGGSNDIFGIQLDPQQLKRYCVSFQATPLGTQKDLQVFDGSLLDVNWDAVWQVRTTFTNDGWIAEFAIPFTSLRYNKSSKHDTASWGISFFRLARRDYEETTFPPIPQSLDAYQMSYAASLKLIPPKKVLNLRVQPYLLLQNSTSTSTRFKTGGEIKWAPSPSSVIDLTVNTDFAQADVDRAVNNLTRFNIFFPERRQFFLENSGLYSGAADSDIKPFFSRRIGLENTGFNAGSVPIDAGLRYTGKNKTRSIAGLYVHQRATDIQPGVHFGVARFIKNYGSQNNAGIMVTERYDETDKKQQIAGRHNSTITADGFIRSSNKLAISWMASVSRDNNNDSIGTAISLNTVYTSNKWFSRWSSKMVSEKYSPGMGFIFGNDIAYHLVGGYRIFRAPTRRWWRRYDPGFFANYFQNLSDGKLQQAYLYIFPVYIILQTGGEIEYAVYPNWQNINFNFKINGVLMEQKNYFYTRHRINVSSDASRKLSFNGSVETGKYYNGNLSLFIIGCRIAPVARFAFSASLEHDRFHKIGIRDTSFSSNLLLCSARFALNARLQGSVFYQFNSSDGQERWNARASWEFRPLSYVFLILNDRRYRNTGSVGRDGVLKITYLKQF